VLRLRKRDLPATPVEPPKAPEAKAEPPEWVALTKQIQELQARLAAMHKEMADSVPGPTLEQVQELLQAVPAQQQVAPVGTGSEWDFDVKRGPYNEILSVRARRVSAGGVRPN
jgi:hypothetical protein